MILMMSMWGLLFGITVIIGVAVLHLLQVNAVCRSGDRLFVSIWAGLLSLCVGLLCVALFTPLTWHILLFLLMIAGALLLHRGIRNELTQYRRLLTPDRIVVGLLLTLMVAYAEVQPVCDRDVLIYHLDNIHALSRTGVVPGLALIYNRYGFASSWFTIPALFNHGPFTMHMVTVGNGFAFLLMLGQLQMAAVRILSRRSLPVDWFLLSAFLIPTVIPVFLNFSVSTTPDFTLILGNMVIVWVSLMIFSGAPAWRSARPLREQLLPVFLAACMFTIKMLALPMIAAMGLTYLLYQRFRLSAWVISGTLVAGVVFPFIAALTLMTGFPLYPTPLGLDLPWTLSRDGYHLAHKRWGVPGDTNAPYLSLDWLKEWLSLSPDCQIGFALFVASVGALVWIMCIQRRRAMEVFPCLLAGTVGISFLILKAPSVRFGWSYLAMMPCAVAFLYADILQQVVKKLPWIEKTKWLQNGLPALIWLVFVYVVSVIGHTESETRIAQADREGRIQLDRSNILLWAPIPPRVLYDDERGVAEAYREFEDRSDARLDSPRPMFHPLILREGLRYLDEEKGVYGGFAHDD